MNGKNGDTSNKNLESKKNKVSYKYQTNKNTEKLVMILNRVIQKNYIEKKFTTIQRPVGRITILGDHVFKLKFTKLWNIIPTSHYTDALIKDTYLSALALLDCKIWWKIIKDAKNKNPEVLLRFSERYTNIKLKYGNKIPDDTFSKALQESHRTVDS
ncbi:hypothetical protein BB561_004408 [Smittium simulii]|uniref:Uncharacterized protein n=1 Tax=Smittium simulii TaxID=133385 RepID=A0A2T9YGH6_9FUNG|nr:hypothetical protein BB561_004408 [Smittium simulii]